MQQFQVRTDLALEATESVRKQEAGNIRGVVMEEYDVLEDVHITKVEIKSRNAQKSLGKPIGTYITLEAASLQENDEDYHREISEELARQLRSVLPAVGEKEQSILIVGLGNRDVTADALGPCIHLPKATNRGRQQMILVRRILLPDILSENMERKHIMHNECMKSAVLFRGLWRKQAWRLLKSSRES